MKTFKDEIQQALKSLDINTREFFNKTMEVPKPLNITKSNVKTFTDINFVDIVIKSI